MRIVITYHKVGFEIKYGYVLKVFILAFNN